MSAPRRRMRQNSNVFNMLTKSQIVQLREAFNLLDTDGDSKLSVQDLTTFLDGIGSPLSKSVIEEMIAELEPNCNFMMLLTCIGEKMSDISSEKDLLASLRTFDGDGDGLIDSAVLKHWLTQKGECISTEDYDYLVKGCLDGNKVDYPKLASKIKHGEIITTQEESQNVESS